MLLAGLVLASLQVAAPPPDVLVLVADDLADTDLDTISTPNIDALAARGVRFRRAYAHPFCKPSRLTMLFGTWETTMIGRECERSSEPPPLPTTRDSLPGWLAGAEYATALFGKWHAGANPDGNWELAPSRYGFELWRAGSAGNVDECGGRNYSSWMRADDGRSAQESEYHTIAVRDALLSWWAVEPERPRFAWVGFQAPHVPLHVPPRSVLPGGACAQRSPSKREKYECMVQSLDQVVGEILSAVDLERTLVIFVGDNGTPTAAVRPDQDARKVKKTTFEDGIRVPLIVAGPGVGGGRETDALAHVVDLIATLADGLELPRPEGAAASVSLWPVLTGARDGVREHVFSGFGPADGEFRERAIVTERWKLREARDALELYDLAADPREEAPVDLDSVPEVAARLRALLVDP